MEPEGITPPPTPPRVAFDPPLFLQRRTTVFDILHRVHKLPRFNGKLRSLLDVGCGSECLFLGSLIAPNSDLPLDQVTGIDLDNAIFDSTLIDSLGPNGMHEGHEGRWRKFGLTLLHGSFEGLYLRNLAHHDIVVSAEVIEHLDPGPLANFSMVLLGQLRPKVCIITTPNRDFNDLFNLPFTPQDIPPNSSTSEERKQEPALGEIVDPNTLGPGRFAPALHPLPPEQQKAWEHLAPRDMDSSTDKYWRAGVPYGMRHPDHRFEWSREEFRQWAIKSAEEFGYDVAFDGVGGLGRGMCVIGSIGWAVGDALARGCGYDKGAEVDRDDPDYGVLAKAHEVWGDCTQIAIFTVKEEEEEDNDDFINTFDWSRKQTNPGATATTSPLNPHYSPNPISQVVHHDYPYQEDDGFPPNYLTVMELLEKEMGNYLPNRIQKAWRQVFSNIYTQNNPFRGVTEMIDREEGIANESDSECDYHWNPEVDGDEEFRQARKKERRYEKRVRREMENAVLGGKKPSLIRVVKVSGVSLKVLWDGSMGGRQGLRRLCRFREDIFRSVLMEGWKSMLGEGTLGEEAEGASLCKTIIDTTGLHEFAGKDDQPDESPLKRRQLSITQGSSGLGSASQTSSPTKLRQKLFPPPESPPRLSNPTVQDSPQVLTSHIFTSFDCPTSGSSDVDLIVPGQENTSPKHKHKRKRSYSVPSLITPMASETMHPYSPQSLSQSSPTTQAQDGKQLPIQLESDSKMVVKLYSASATRSVMDLITRGLRDDDRKALKRWKIVKVEFNPEISNPSIENAAENDTHVCVEADKGVHWNDHNPGENEGPESWEVAEMPSHNTWDTWDPMPLDGVVAADPANHYGAPEEDNMSLGSNGHDQYSEHREANPWNTDHDIPTTNLHTELIYPLDNVDAHLSIDKGKQREQNSLQSDLKGFLNANKTLESNDQGILNIDWKEYIQSRSRVARWMEERRLEFNEYKEARLAWLVNGGNKPVRKIVAWDEWLAASEKIQQEGNLLGHIQGGGSGSRGEELEVGIVLYRPDGKGNEGGNANGRRAEESREIAKLKEIKSYETAAWVVGRTGSVTGLAPEIGCAGGSVGAGGSGGSGGSVGGGNKLFGDWNGFTEG